MRALNITIRGEPIVVACEGPRVGITSQHSPERPGGCMEGPAASLFATMDADQDFRLSTSEASRVARVLASHERVESRAACQVQVSQDALDVCFGHASGTDSLLDRHEYTAVYVPCLTRGLPVECRSLLCNDFL